MQEDPHKMLAESDHELVRAFEDVANVLLDKGIIRNPDLPQAAHAKPLRRHLWRRRPSSRTNPRR